MLESDGDRRALVARLTRQLAHRSGALLSGPPGIGKTHTLNQATSTIDPSLGTTLHLRASSSMSSVPFGAFLPLLDGVSDPVPQVILDLPEPLRTAAILRRRAVDARITTLVIDDAHLLDSGSAGLVHQFVTSGVTLLASMRSGEAMPEAIASLVAAGLLTREEVPALGLDETKMLVSHVLSGAVDAGLAWAVHERSRGHPLRARVLVQEGKRRGAIVRKRFVWALNGPLTITDDLAQLLMLDLDSLSAQARRAVTMVAVANGLSVEVLAATVGRSALEIAEDAGLLVVDGEQAMVSHPLYRDAVMSSLTRNAYRETLAQLVSAVEASSRDADRVAVARWRVALGDPPDTANLLALATLTSDLGTVELFLRAAMEIDPASAVQRLVQLLIHQHRGEESLQVVDSVDLSSVPPNVAVELELSRGFASAMLGQAPAQAISQLNGLGARVGFFPMLNAIKAIALWRDGQFGAGIELATSVYRQDVDLIAAANAGLTMLTLQAQNADVEAFQSERPGVERLVGAASDAIPEGSVALELTSVLALVSSLVDLPAAQERAERGYFDALGTGEEGLRGQWGHLLGQLKLLDGDAEAAVRLIRESEVTSGIWSRSNLPWVRAGLVDALVCAGMQTDAESVYADLIAEPSAGMYRGDLARAQAAVVAGRGDLAQAAQIAASAAALTPAGGRTAESVLWYAALRYGDKDAAAPFLASIDRMPGPAREAQRLHANALAAGRAEQIEAAARALNRAGLRWYAIEAMAAAAAALRQRGNGPAFTQVSERLAGLRQQSPTLVSAVVRALGHHGLTARESQVARLAAESHTDRAIADRLSISVRTVESHLGRAYAKLGLRGRTELAYALNGPSHTATQYPSTDAHPAPRA